MEALSGRDKVRPSHLTHETFSGRRPVDGADTLGGVFRPGENFREKEILPTSSGGEGENDIRKDVRPRDDSS